MLHLQESAEWRKGAEKVVPACVQDVTPSFLRQARGASLGTWTPMSTLTKFWAWFGHGHIDVNRAVAEQMVKMGVKISRLNGKPAS
jgi:hypothetical protein